MGSDHLNAKNGLNYIRLVDITATSSVTVKCIPAHSCWECGKRDYAVTPCIHGILHDHILHTHTCMCMCVCVCV